MGRAHHPGDFGPCEKDLPRAHAVGGTDVHAAAGAARKHAAFGHTPARRKVAVEDEMNAHSLQGAVLALVCPYAEVVDRMKTGAGEGECSIR